MPALVDGLFRQESAKLISVLARHFGFSRLDQAEDLVQETLMAAMLHWPIHGAPDNPSAWLMQVAKNKARNRLRDERRHHELDARKLETEASSTLPEPAFLKSDVEDCQLRMIFACAHPQIAPPDQLALILRTMSGFDTQEIARALLISNEAVNKRIYRARKNISEQGIELETPGGDDAQERIQTVCHALYLMFNEGYLATQGDEPISKELCLESLRLALLVQKRFPDAPFVSALISLFCFHAARFESRVDEVGGLVWLAEQDRSLWNKNLISMGLDYLSRASSGDLTPYHLEASIAAQHCLARDLASTNWSFIAQLYKQLYKLTNNPLVRLNMAIVKGWTSGASAAIDALKPLEQDRKLARHPLLYAALAEFQTRAGQMEPARANLRLARRFSFSSRESDEFAARLALLE